MPCLHELLNFILALLKLRRDIDDNGFEKWDKTKVKDSSGDDEILEAALIRLGVGPLPPQTPLVVRNNIPFETLLLHWLRLASQLVGTFKAASSGQPRRQNR